MNPNPKNIALGVMIDEATAKRIDDAARRRRRTTGENWTQASTLRDLITRALDAEEPK